MQRQMFTDGFEMIRDANVEVKANRDAKGHTIATVEIDGIYQCDFPHTSRVSQALDTVQPQEIANRMNGGNFFLKNGNLIDFRYGDSNQKFVHTADSIQSLIDHIGWEEHKGGRRQINRLVARDVKLSKVRSATAIVVPEMQDGGNMESRLSFNWNPFQQFINTSFELVRLICANGMMGVSSFLNAKIPMVNDWDNHMNIANKQIQNKVTSMVGARVLEMASQPASIRDCQQVVGHCMARLESDLNTINNNPQAYKILVNNAEIASPQLHLSDVYSERTLTDQRLADQYGSHLTLYTVWNMLTELASHTVANENSSDFALDRLANQLLFDRIGGLAARSVGVANLSSNFNNVEAALMGHQL